MKKNFWLGLLLIPTLTIAGFSKQKLNDPDSDPTVQKWDKLIVAGNEMETQGNLNAIRINLSMYLSDHHKYPSRLDPLLTPHYLALKELPLTKIPGHHEPSNKVIYIKNRRMLTDEGGWAYLNDPASPEFGDIVVNCIHNDSHGRKWCDLK